MKWVVPIIQALLIAGFLMAGLSKLFLSADQMAAMYTDTLGYGAGFMYAVGAIETLAAIVLFFGFWKRTAAIGAAALLTAIMIGAIVSSLFAGLAANIGLPLIYLVLLVIFIIAGRGGRRIGQAAVSQAK